SVVVISAPPNWLPSKTSGRRLARAVYSAAVYPAGPEPMMITLRNEVSVLTCGPSVGRMRGYGGRVQRGCHRPQRILGAPHSTAAPTVRVCRHLGGSLGRRQASRVC